MNANTGVAYDLGKDLVRSGPLGEPIDATNYLDRFEALDRPATTDEMACAVDIAKGDPILAISQDAAQRLRLGERELERRARRRKAAKQARKRNR